MYDSIFVLLVSFSILTVGPFTEQLDKFVWTVMMVTAPLGIKYALEKEWEKHRICMIYFSAALFTVANVRTFWYLLNNVFRSAETYDGDVGKVMGTVDEAGKWSVVVTFGVAILYTLPFGKEKTAFKTKKQ